VLAKVASRAPWVLRDQLLEGLPYLVKLLAQDDAAEFTLEASPAT